MLSYSICKSLKEAGFPQKETDYGFAYYQGSFLGDNEIHLILDSRGFGKLAKCPTLEELIGACGVGFWRLEKCDENWQAESIYQIPQGFAPTLEEAVAKLWLELNKK